MSVENIDAKYDRSEKLDDIVFQHRNKAYGAFALRQNYRFTLTKAFIVGTALFLIGAISPLVYMKLKENSKQEEKIVSIEMDEIVDLPPPVEEEQQAPPPEPPKVEEPPEQEIVKDMIPEPKPNPKVEEPPKKIEEVKETTIGTINQEGPKVATYTPPPPPKSSGAGTNVEAPKPVPTNEIIEVVDQQADFNGGLNKFRNLFQSNFDPSAVEGEGTLETVVTFVVERDGSLSQVKASGSNSDFNREAERAVKSVKGKWSPGKLNGQPVRSRFRFPVKMNFEY
ncbi:energy transducer TonB [Elizabethkingia sp. JS20170427COW]|uniref:energy transducer TonB n=1 Tax=Elizabethkingia sp. JS20170427COW TaxID=2583851 RepID=UPI001110AB0B|nr:energy transducer TonB [Elizabethkingia sp. JS20170427COW]QCX53396.1 energy transducer TonB [Elizabethkingia sp. JS20170427COW]